MATIRGTNESDRLQGTPEGDLIQGYKGDDWLSGGFGSDSIYGGKGEDILLAGENLADRITESDSKIGDRLTFLNLLNGGDGDDLLVGSHANDLERGGNGEDLLLGHRGADLLLGGNGKDILRGHGGADTLLGGNARDILRGHSGDDVLRGGNGDDYLYGWNAFKAPNSSNVDNFTGGSGRDKFILGNSYETFYQVGQDADLAVIEDLELEKDVIRLNGDVEDYSLQVDTMTIDDQVVTGTYINYDVYEAGETIGFVVGQTEINLEAEYFEFV